MFGRHLSFTGVVENRETEPLERKVLEVYAELRMPVERYLSGILHDAAAAEDLTQETFLRLFQELRKGTPIRHLKGWVFRVAYNLAIDYRKKNAGAESLGDVHRDTISAPGPGNEERLGSQQRYAAVLAALPLLSAREQECLSLRAEGLTYREIGEVLGITASSVAVFLARGVQKINQMVTR